jgi:hypothetical protein
MTKQTAIKIGLLLLGLTATSSASAQQAAAGVAPAPVQVVQPPTVQPFPGAALGPVAPVAQVAPAPPPERPTGLAFIISGALLSLAGAGNLATAPLCSIAGNLRSPGLCTGLSVAFGGAFLAAGIPLLVVGIRQRQQFTVQQLTVQQLTVAPTVGGFAVKGTW